MRCHWTQWECLPGARDSGLSQNTLTVAVDLSLEAILSLQLYLTSLSHVAGSASQSHSPLLCK